MHENRLLFVWLVVAVAAAWAFARPALALDPPIPLDSGLKPSDVGNRPYTDYVRECVDLLMQHGTDHYGSVNTPILMSIIDVRDRTSPQDPLALDEAVRVMRRGRRNPAGSNLWMDQATIGVMYKLTEQTGQAGYAQFANNYINYYTQPIRHTTNFVSSKGLINWGWHQYYDAYRDVKTYANGDHHEIHFQPGLWSKLRAVNPAAITNEIQGIWQWHVVNKSTGEINRHGDGQSGCDFTFTGGTILSAFAFQYQQTGNQQWLDRAKLVANYYWGRRNTATNLVATTPRLGSSQFDGCRSDTSTTGLYCGCLLDAYTQTNDQQFLDQAVAYLKAYARYGYDSETGKFWGSLQLNGTPVAGPRGIGYSTDNYSQYEPRGHVDLWQPFAAGDEKPLDTALTYAKAAKLTGDPELGEAARRWADFISQSLPAGPCETVSWYADYARTWAPLGTYAENYGKAIKFFVDMAELTDDAKYIGLARSIADDAVSKLYYDGLIRGHPGKPYYEAIDGVGYLLEALVELDGATRRRK